jgi:hypothetical protein
VDSHAVYSGLLSATIVLSPFNLTGLIAHPQQAPSEPRRFGLHRA